MDLSLENVKEIVQRQESMPDILLICDSSGRILHINENGRKILSIATLESAISMSLTDFLSETDRKYLETVILPNVSKSGEFEGRGLHLMKKDGSFLQTKQHAYLMPEMSYLFVFTEDKESEAEKKEALYKAFQQSQNGMFLTDKEGVILAVNKQFEKISGLKENELIGKTPKAFQSGMGASKTFYDEFWESVLQGSVSIANSNLKNGFVKDWKQNVIPIRDRNGEVSSFLSTILANPELPESGEVRNNSDFAKSPSDTFRKYEGLDREALIGILRDKTKLTKKETEICAGIASGKDKSRISEDLGIHPGTMKNHLKSIYRKTIDLEKEIPGPERDKLQRLTIYLFRLLGE